MTDNVAQTRIYRGWNTPGLDAPGNDRLMLDLVAQVLKPRGAVSIYANTGGTEVTLPVRPFMALNARLQFVLLYTVGEEALQAMGTAYMQMLLSDRTRLRGQMQAYAACGDEDVCAVVRAGFGDLVAYAERVSGLPPEDISSFFARGMLLNVLSSMNLSDPSEPWALRLLEGCGKTPA